MATSAISCYSGMVPKARRQTVSKANAASPVQARPLNPSLRKIIPMKMLPKNRKEMVRESEDVDHCGGPVRVYLRYVRAHNSERMRNTAAASCTGYSPEMGPTAKKEMAPRESTASFM